MKIVEYATLQSFHMCVAKQLESDAASVMSPEEALVLWRAEQESIAGIRERLADVNASQTSLVVTSALVAFDLREESKSYRAGAGANVLGFAGSV